MPTSNNLLPTVAALSQWPDIPSDTTQSINYLQSDTIDIGITYNPAAEAIAIDQGIVKGPAYYDWRDQKTQQT